jgi:hypothetical protein
MPRLALIISYRTLVSSLQMENTRAQKLNCRPRLSRVQFVRSRRSTTLPVAIAGVRLLM